MTKENPVSSNEINSILIETRRFDAPAEFTAKARLQAADLEALYQHAADDHLGFWAEQARELIDWHKPFTTVLDDSKAPHYKWFTGGEMNVSWNCIDKHLAPTRIKPPLFLKANRVTPATSVTSSFTMRCASLLTV